MDRAWPEAKTNRIECEDEKGDRKRVADLCKREREHGPIDSKR
jgi:hypothetical protein